MSELDLSESEVTDVGLKKICNCGKLRKLDLNTCKGFRRLVTAEGWLNDDNVIYSVVD